MLAEPSQRTEAGVSARNWTALASTCPPVGGKLPTSHYSPPWWKVRRRLSIARYEVHSKQEEKKTAVFSRFLAQTLYLSNTETWQKKFSETVAASCLTGLPSPLPLLVASRRGSAPGQGLRLHLWDRVSQQGGGRAPGEATQRAQRDQRAQEDGPGHQVRTRIHTSHAGAPM